MAGRVVPMSTATGSFDLADWQDEILDKQSTAVLGRSTSRKTYQGDLTGEAALNMLSVSGPVAGADEPQGIAYVALERVTGTLAGRTGSFVLLHRADPTGFTITVVAGTADAELAGLTGELTITHNADGSRGYTLEYQLP
jgi:hypothetical protein